MTRLTLGQRMGAVACLMLLTVSISLFYFITKGFSKDIAFAVSEQLGIEYQRPLEELLELVPTHGLLVRRFLHGEKELEGRIETTERQVDEALQRLEGVDRRIGRNLQFTPEGLAKRKREHYTWSTVQQEWESLKRGRRWEKVENSDQLHAHLVSDIRTMITHAGDTSNLILDPDLDSYYLMDVTLLALPQTQDRLAKIEILGQKAIENGRIVAGQLTQLAVAAALLKESDVDRMMLDIETSLNEDDNFYGPAMG